MITATPIPIFSDNYVWLARDGTGAVAVVDPADAEPVLAAIRAAGGRCDLILITHHHADHIAGVDAVRAATGAKVAGNAADAQRLPRLDIALRPGESVKLGGSSGVMMDTPGHTVGHVSFAFPGAVFCGDVLFSLGCGRVMEGSAAQMFKSIADLAALPADTLVCCGHEYTLSNARFALHADPANPELQARAREVEAQRARGEATVPTTIARERATNPFVRAADVAAFAKLRAEKDIYK